MKVVDFDSKDKMKASVAQMKRDLMVCIEYTEVIAEIRKSSYDAHIKQGFTPEQALELCKSMIL